MALEMMAETVQSCITSGNRISSFEDVEFGLQSSDKVPQRDSLHSGGNRGRMGRGIQLQDSLGSPRWYGRTRVHHTAIIALASKNPQEKIDDLITTDEDGSRILGAVDIYGLMFHGPRFQPLKGVVATIETTSGTGIEARVNSIQDLPDPRLFNIRGKAIIPNLTSYPLLIESCFQAAGAHIDGSGFGRIPPRRAKRILIAGEIPGGSLTVTSVGKGSETNGTFVHESVIRLDGSPIMRIDGLKMENSET